MASPIPQISTPTRQQTPLPLTSSIPLLLPQTPTSSALPLPVANSIAPELVFNTIIPPTLPITADSPETEITVHNENQQHNLSTQKFNDVLPSPVQMYDISSPPIPFSHLITENSYPSLRHVPSNIVQSFSPVFVQPANNSVDGGDIYTDYVNNPYNLTLQEQTSSSSQTETQNSTPVKLNVPPNNVFQSVNYFSFESANIPPGSEMLFGGP